MVHEQLMKFFSGYRRDAHPMATLVGVVGALSAFYHDSVDISDPWQREVAAVRMIAKLPTITAMAYKYSIGQPFVYPKNSLDYAANFLYMCFSVPAEEYEVNPILSRAILYTLSRFHCQNGNGKMSPAKSLTRSGPKNCFTSSPCTRSTRSGPRSRLNPVSFSEITMSV